MDYSIQLKELPDQLALCTEHTATLQTIPAAMIAGFTAIMGSAGDGGPRFAGPPFVLYPPEIAGEFTMVVCLPVADDSPEPTADSGVTLRRIAGGQAACLLHTGPYDELNVAWDVLRTWLRANGKTTTGKPRETYLNDPGSVPAAELLTEVAWPLG
jgi:AraC family transcriptional regulator